MSDRGLVMREGRQLGVFDRSQATQETIMTAAMGQLSEIASTVEAMEYQLSADEPAGAEESA